MARPNPKDVSIGSVVKTNTVNLPFTPTQTPAQLQPPAGGAVNVPQTGAVSMQGGTRAQPKPPRPEPTECWEVYGNKLELTQAAVDYYKNIGVDIKRCNGSTPPPTNGNLEQRVKELEQLQWEIYPQAIGTTSQRSDVDIWNHLSQWVWGHGGEKWQAGGLAPKWDKPEPTAIVPHFSRLHQEQEMRLTEAHAHRQSIETKVEDLYTKKSDVGHKHGGNGTDWGVVVMGIVAIILILLAVKYLFPLLGGLKRFIPKKGNGNGNGYVEPHGGFM